MLKALSIVGCLGMAGGVVTQKSDALIFKGKQKTTVSAWVCAACSYDDFHADSPSTIKLPRS